MAYISIYTKQSYEYDYVILRNFSGADAVQIDVAGILHCLPFTFVFPFLTPFLFPVHIGSYLEKIICYCRSVQLPTCVWTKCASASCHPNSQKYCLQRYVLFFLDLSNLQISSKFLWYWFSSMIGLYSDELTRWAFNCC